MDPRIIMHSCNERKEYFFSTDHRQGVEGRGEGTYPEGFVPITFYLPMSVVPRPSLPSGRVETLADLLMIFFKEAHEIPNPDPKYQPCF